MTVSIHDLDEIREEYMEKQILINFLGCHNVGKSTLLNSLLRARLACTDYTDSNQKKCSDGVAE